MRENDIIAEYVKEKYPELLITPEFTFYKQSNAGNMETADNEQI